MEMENDDFMEEIILDDEVVEEDGQTGERDNVSDTFQLEFDRIIREHVLDTYEEGGIGIETGFEEVEIEADNNTCFDVALATDAGANDQLTRASFENVEVEVQHHPTTITIIDDDDSGTRNSPPVVLISNNSANGCDNAFSSSNTLSSPPEEKKRNHLSSDDMQKFDSAQQAPKRQAVKKYNGEKTSYPGTCDCLIVTCPGCHYPCGNCGSRFCGHECRIRREWNYEEFEIQGHGTRKRKLDNVK